MKKFIFFISLCFGITSGFAQSDSCTCKDDLLFLNKKIEQTPAYKTNKKAYNIAYAQVLNEVESVTSLYNCGVLLNRLILALNDNHSRIYSLATGATKAVRDSAEDYAAFKKSPLYNTYPKTVLDLDSLTAELNSKLQNAKEGIYAIKDFASIGVYKILSEPTYKAIVLSSETDLWEKGEELATLIPFGEDNLLCIGGSLGSKRLIAFNERIQNGIFSTMGFTKASITANYASQTLSDSTYYREDISKEITYLKVGSFSSWYPRLGEAERFYASIKGTLKSKHLILDLRNNTGGGDRNSDILFKILKPYLKKNKIAVLVNHRTMSNAEQFAYKLSDFENCTVFGRRTNGTLAYEIKDSSYNLPCGNFVAVLTAKKISKYLALESKGVTPDVTLETDSDWIAQVIAYLTQQN
jgi:Peptidase family S41